MTRDDLDRFASELGIDAIGAAPAEPYVDTEQQIRERRGRGLFADMRFTMAQPEVSCHPELLVPGAQSVVSAALCYWEPGLEPGLGEGRLPRYTWHDAVVSLEGELSVPSPQIADAVRELDRAMRAVIERRVAGLDAK